MTLPDDPEEKGSPSTTFSVTFSSAKDGQLGPESERVDRRTSNSRSRSRFEARALPVPVSIFFESSFERRRRAPSSLPRFPDPFVPSPFHGSRPIKMSLKREASRNDESPKSRDSRLASSLIQGRIAFLWSDVRRYPVRE